MSHVTKSLCGGEFRGGRGQGAAGSRSEGTPDPHSPGVHTAGCATGTGPIACAVASPAAMTRELRATAPPGRAVPSPLRACGAALARPSPRRHWPYAALGRLVDVSRDPVRRKGDGPKRRRANDAHRRAGPKPSKLATPSGDEAQDGEEASATLVLLECTRLSLRAPPLTSHSSQTQ